ncbi:peptidase U32 family protein [Plebeiibacterium sediminum]|uniref:U32 family peptidase n=1 Tax=Plebeiibacterium sediminum TaxID=2992112 RepID=A0AAE3M6X7_9BACT|nr:DUF3656 domain-containing protein [Plebeiobacterium sediminum]MCW3788239.1 U32 family peptidase [Plebeiobacterium sediminum]
MRKMELLAPGGDVDSIKAAIIGGADAVYCGLNKFNARNRAANISIDDLMGIVKLAHEHNCEVFLTLNILILESEIPALFQLLNRLVNTHIDGVIIQDLGLFYLLNTYFKTLPIHASTQFTTHNSGQVKFLSKLGATRVNLCRELSLDEIKDLNKICNSLDVQTEVFVHGSQCLCFSGICYMSSVQSGNSGNRGRCSQPCRDQYQTTNTGHHYPLNLKDNSAYNNIEELYQAGVYSLKIEGRIKKYDYIYSVVNTYKQKIKSLDGSVEFQDDHQRLYKVFNRDFSNGYLRGDINQMFIDNPRDQTLQHLFNTQQLEGEEEKEKAALQLYSEKDLLKQEVKTQIDQLSIDKIPLTIKLSGEMGQPLMVTVISTEKSFTVSSKAILTDKGTESLSKEVVLKRLKAINDLGFVIDKMELGAHLKQMFIPFKELTSIKKMLLYLLNDSKEIIEHVSIPKLKTLLNTNVEPSLSVVISSLEDLDFCQQTDAKIYFRIPSSIGSQWDKLVQLFQNNRNLIPWFPAVIIGDDYEKALEFILTIQPGLVVTDNSGIAFTAYEHGIPWIAGPGLNIINSYSLKTLKETFNAAGAFVSNEINKMQVQRIVKPREFKLFYSIYHPIELMTTRQCLFKQTIGCNKAKMDHSCLATCSKAASITNMNGSNYIIEKSKGNYHRIYNDQSFLNLDIIEQIPNFFNELFIDLSNVKTNTEQHKNTSALISLFSAAIKGDRNAKEKLRDNILHTTCKQYVKGL